MNIFSALYLSGEDGELKFKVFRYDPFKILHLGNSKSLRDYFQNNIPNYYHHPLKIETTTEFCNAYIENNFFGVVRKAFNSSLRTET